MKAIYDIIQSIKKLIKKLIYKLSTMTPTKEATR